MLSSTDLLKMSSGVKLTFDGNSLTFGTGASDSAHAFPAQLAGLAPVSGSGATINNVGIFGQTWRQMNGLDGGSTSDVDGSFVTGRTNVLFAWETTNAVTAIGRTAAQCVQDASDYVTARLALHPWKIVLITSLPRQIDTQGSTRDAPNAAMVAVDDFFRANYRKMGAAALLDVRRPGSPFALPDYSDASFATTDPYFTATEAASGGRTHLSDAGYALIARWCGEVVRRLPRR